MQLSVNVFKDDQPKENAWSSGKGKENEKAAAESPSRSASKHHTDLMLVCCQNKLLMCSYGPLSTPRRTSQTPD